MLQCGITKHTETINGDIIARLSASAASAAPVSVPTTVCLCRRERIASMAISLDRQYWLPAAPKMDASISHSLTLLINVLVVLVLVVITAIGYSE